MELTRILWDENDGVGSITLNRPARMNALDLRTIVELDHVIERATNRPAVRCLLNTGNGRGFSAGADVKEWGSGGDDDPDGDGWVPRMHRVMTRLYRLPKPVIAAGGTHQRVGPASRSALAATSRSWPTCGSPRRRRASGRPMCASATAPTRAAPTCCCN